MATKAHKLRLYGKTKPKATNPINPAKKYTLRVLDEVDGRYAVVKRLRESLAKLISDCEATTIQQQWLCNRATTLNSFCESVEVRHAEGKAVKWSVYMQASRTLTDILNKLGLDPGKRSTQTLNTYLNDARKKSRTKRKA